LSNITQVASVRQVMHTSAGEGLAAGLTSAMAAIGAAPATRRGVTLLPREAFMGVREWHLGGVGYGSDEVAVRIVHHPFAATEGLDLIHVAATVPGTRPAAADRIIAASLALLAVRLGLLSRVLDLAVTHLSERQAEGSPLIGKQLLQGAVADVVTVIEAGRHCLDLLGAAATPPRSALDLMHQRVGTAGWQLITMFGASGYLREHPVRCLYVADLIAACWAAGPSLDLE